MGRTSLSQTGLAKQVQKVLELSERKIINALEGKTKGIPEKVLLATALEIYKRRVPIKVEKEGGGNQLTMIKIIKNHLPESAEKVETIDAATDPIDTIDKVEQLAEEVVINIQKKEEPKPRPQLEPAQLRKADIKIK